MTSSCFLSLRRFSWNRSASFCSARDGGNQRGFTLIEILVVISIIGVLVGLVGGNFLTSRMRARDAERKNSVGQLQRAVELYYNDHGAYPISSGGLLVVNNISLPWGGPFVDESGTTYMAQLPVDSRSPTINYYYETNPDGTKYRIYARLENEQDSDTDLNNDGTPGDEYDGTMADQVQKYCATVYCNYGIPSPTTTMEEIW